MLVKIRRILNNLLIDLRYGSFLGSNLRPLRLIAEWRAGRSAKVETPYWRADWIGCYNNSDSHTLKLIFEDRIEEDDVLVDIGCGRGRVINWWLANGYRNRMIGLEIDEPTVQGLKQRVRRYPNVEIIAGDAVEHLPGDGTIYYMFNPFPPDVVEALQVKLIETLENPHRFTLLYYNCIHADVFEQNTKWDVERTRLGEDSDDFQELAIIRLKARESLSIGGSGG